MSNLPLAMPVKGAQSSDLGDGRTINLREYLKYEPRKIEGAKFLYYKFLNIDNFNIDTIEFRQMSIRAEQLIRENVDNIKNNIMLEGWDVSQPIPVEDLKGIIQFGHHRVVAMKELGMSYMPIAVYDYGDMDEDDQADIALIDNEKVKPSADAKMDDYIKRGTTKVMKGKLTNDIVAIEEWLYNKMNLQGSYAKGTITKIIKGIQRRVELGGELNVLIKDRDDHVEYCNDNGYVIDDNNRIILQMDRISYAWRAFCGHTIGRTTPVEIVLYTQSNDPAVSRANLERFKNEMDRLYTSMYETVDPSQYAPDNVTVSTPSEKKRVYKLIGCVPQIVGSHDKYLQKGELVPVDKY